MSGATDKITAGGVRAAIQRQYPQPRYAVLFEVLDATGARHTRSADVVVMSCWPSMGLELHGMEIKVSRYDWRKEVDQPEKAETIASYCDRWSLVTGLNVVADISEIPAAWGWIEFDGKRLTTRREAAKNENPKPVSRLFLASLLRNASKVEEAMVNAVVEERIAAEKAKIDDVIQQRVDHRTKDYATLLKTVTDFEAASGIQLAKEATWGWLQTDDGKAIGTMAKALRESGLASGWGGISSLESSAKKIIEEIAKLREITGIEKPIPLDQFRKKRA